MNINNCIKSDLTACGHVYMVVTVRELRGLKENPTQFLVLCLSLLNKYLTLNLQQGHPELMTVVNTAGLRPTEGRAVRGLSCKRPSASQQNPPLIMGEWRRGAVNSSVSCSHTWPWICYASFIVSTLYYDAEGNKQQWLKLFSPLKRAAWVCPALLKPRCDTAAFNYLPKRAAPWASPLCSRSDFVLTQLF